LFRADGPGAKPTGELERIVSQCWLNFAANGDPNGPGLPTWPAYVPGTDSVLHIGKTIASGPLPNQAYYYAFWDKLAVGWKGPQQRPGTPNEQSA
jgi:carboxylesterase type B